MRKVVFVLALLGILILGLLVDPMSVPVANADAQTYCWCVYQGLGVWGYHCCDLVNGCYDLYCDTVCP